MNLLMDAGKQARTCDLNFNSSKFEIKIGWEYREERESNWDEYNPLCFFIRTVNLSFVEINNWNSSDLIDRSSSRLPNRFY